MPEFFIRTEDIKSDEILSYFVESSGDRRIIDALKGRSPIVLLGSRGVGKSFLLKVAQAELMQAFSTNRVLPVYLSFTKSSLVKADSALRFQHWMMARLCSAILRALAKEGLLTILPRAATLLAGQNFVQANHATRIENVAEAFEESWKDGSKQIDVSVLPDVDQFKDAIEDICDQLRISRLAVFIDEAAHIFLPEQQRQFFTLFRDLRSPYLTCNAAVYPGVTSFGDTFQPVHDATVMTVDRNIADPEYISNMREIVEKQAESNLLGAIQRNGQNFAVLAYAATGNPRVLLKTLGKAPRVSSSEVNEVVRDYYRTEAWAEHTQLAERYPGHRKLIDWGRTFIESEVLPEIRSKNQKYLEESKGTSAFFWIHRDVPKIVEQAINILSYTGIVVANAQGIKATRAELGTRYLVNLGCLFALESAPAASAFAIAKGLTIKRMTEYGVKHAAFAPIATEITALDIEASSNAALEQQLSRDIAVLDITDWQRTTLRGLGLNTVGAVLGASESKLKEAYYVGDVRSRRMRNAATAAVFEYLSG